VRKAKGDLLPVHDEDPETLFRQLLDTAPVMIWVSGSDKLCTWFNRPWLEFTGRTLAQEYGNGWAEGVHQADLARCLETYVSHFDRRIPFKMEYRLRRADGEYRWILDTGVPRFARDGAFLGYIGSCIDISPLKPAEPADLAGDRTLPMAPSAPEDDTRARQIARTLVTAHRGAAESVAASVAERHAASGDARIADFWRRVVARIREIPPRDD
jgi:PAS domain S-box-containing protein